MRVSLAGLAAIAGLLACAALPRGEVPGTPNAGGPASPFAGLRIPFPGPPACRLQPLGPIAASVYSLPSTLFDHAEAERFLAAVRRQAPARELLVLADPVQRQALAATAAPLGVHLLDTAERVLSPWPRDPLSFLTCGPGKLHLLVRPNLQPTREDDAVMGPLLVSSLPPGLRASWGEPRWSLAPFPFHNGQQLPAEEAIWISLHTLEPHILALLGLERVPVETFATDEGIDRYLEAARRAAAELETVYGAPVRFAHALPEEGTTAERSAAMERIGGGAGFDLDSLLTLLPAAGEAPPTALVGDLGLGAALLEAAGSEIEAFARGYGLVPTALAARLAAVQRSGRAAGLQGFLDLVAERLGSAEGFRVVRLPLLLVPAELLVGREDLLSEGHFLVGWNNAVLERRPEGLHAEGFASFLPAGDEAAIRAFAAAGAELTLLPPLVESVLRNGGYRCASNHVYELPVPRRPGA